MRIESLDVIFINTGDESSSSHDGALRRHETSVSSTREAQLRSEVLSGDGETEGVCGCRVHLVLNLFHLMKECQLRLWLSAHMSEEQSLRFKDLFREAFISA